MEDLIQILEMPSDLHEKFSSHIKENLLSVRLIAHRLDIDTVYLSQILRNKRPFTEKIRQKLNGLLRINY